MRSALLTIVAAAGLLGGCTSEFAFTDSVSSRFIEAMPRAEFGDELATPYVIGAEFTIYVEDRERDSDFTGWKLSVTDPSVLRLRDREPRRVDAFTLAIDVVAAGAGSAEILLTDPSGEVRGSAAAEVRRPTRVKLYAAAIAALGNPDFAGETPRPHVVQGGVASFAVQYLDQDLRLRGSTSLQVGTSRALSAQVVQSEMADDRDVVQIAAGEEPGRHTLELWLGGVLLQEVDVTVVRPSTIAAIDLIDHKGASPDEAAGEWLVVAQAYNDVREPIYGVEFEWYFPGRAYDHTGDILMYAHDPDPESFKRVTARAHGLDAQISVQAADADVYTSNDAAFQCSYAADARPPWWALMLLPLALRRRRR
jgi:hypothetical protein